MELLEITYAVSFWSVCLPILLIVLYFRKFERALKILSAFLFFSAAIDVYGVSLALKGNNNLYLFHIHTIVEFVFLVLVFQQILNKKLFWIIGSVIGGLFILISIYLYFNNNGYEKFNSVSRGIEGIIMIVICLFFLMKVFSEEKIQELSNYPYFLLTCGLLIYFSGTLFLFLSNVGLNRTFFTIHSVLNFILNIFFALTFFKGRKWMENY